MLPTIVVRALWSLIVVCLVAATSVRPVAPVTREDARLRSAEQPAAVVARTSTPRVVARHDHRPLELPPAVLAAPPALAPPARTTLACAPALAAPCAPARLPACSARGPPVG